MDPDAPVEIPQGLENDGPPSYEEYIPPAPIQESTEQPQGVSNAEGGESNSEGTGNASGNPAWSPLLEKVPTPFHNEIKPFLSEWDKNFEKVQSQYAPYKSIIEQGVKPEDINNSLQLAQLINANPRLVFDQLAQRFGFNSGQGHEEDNTEDEDEPNDEENISNPMENPALRPYIERQQQMEQYLAEQAQVAQQQRVDQEIQQEWSAIEKAHGGPIPQDIKTEMIQRAIWIADQKGPDYEPSIKDGYDSYNEFVNKVRGQKANNTAPQVFGGNGGLPSTPAGIHAGMSDEERKDYIAKRAEQLAKQNQD